MFCSKVLPAAGTQGRLVQTTAENLVCKSCKTSSRFSWGEKRIERQIKSVNIHDKSFKKYSTYPAGTWDVDISVLDALKNLIYSKKKDKTVAGVEREIWHVEFRLKFDSMDFNEKSRESAFCRDVFAPKKVKSTSDSGKLHVKVELISKFSLCFANTSHNS